MATLLGWQGTPAASLAPLSLPNKGSLLRPTASQATITVRGVVLDDLYNVLVESAFIFIKDTKYGAVADAEGKFVLVLPTDWPPLKKRVLTLLVTSNPFNFLKKQ